MVAKPRTIQKMASNMPDRHLRRKMSQLMSLRELVAEAELSNVTPQSQLSDGEQEGPNGVARDPIRSSGPDEPEELASSVKLIRHRTDGAFCPASPGYRRR